MKLKRYLINGLLSLIIGIVAKWLNLINNEAFVIIPFLFWILLNQLDNNSQFIGKEKKC